MREGETRLSMTSAQIRDDRRYARWASSPQPSPPGEEREETRRFGNRFVIGPPLPSPLLQGRRGRRRGGAGIVLLLGLLSPALSSGGGEGECGARPIG